MTANYSSPPPHTHKLIIDYCSTIKHKENNCFILYLRIENPNIEEACEHFHHAADGNEGIGRDLEVATIEGQSIVDHWDHEPGEKDNQTAAPHVGSAH